MNPSLLLRSVLLRVWRYKAKSLSMGLGITIGVLATVLLLTIIGTVKAGFVKFLANIYPANSVVVMGGEGPMSQSTAGRDSIRMGDLETIASATGITEWDPGIFAAPREVKRAGTSLRVGLAGFSEKAESIRGRSVQEGEFFTEEDVKNRANVALIGSNTAERLFPGESPIGAQLFIENVPFQVKGILDSAGVDVHGFDQDNTIWMPYTTLMDQILRINYISGAMFIVEDRSRVEEVGREIAQIVRERHQIAPGQKDDFTVITPVLMNQMFERAFRTFTIFIPLIVGTVFLISALVILSIMQISVKGRTPEIGLRKALGARSRDLQIQIVLEVLVIAAISCLIGLLLAQVGIMFAAPILEERMGIKQVDDPSVLVLVLAVAAALATGLLGGILPARRAARLRPVEALK